MGLDAVLIKNNYFNRHLSKNILCEIPGIDLSKVVEINENMFEWSRFTAFHLWLNYNYDSFDHISDIPGVTNIVLECNQIIDIYQLLSSDRIKQDFEHMIEKTRGKDSVKTYNFDYQIEVLRRDFKLLVEEILENNLINENIFKYWLNNVTFTYSSY